MPQAVTREKKRRLRQKNKAIEVVVLGEAMLETLEMLYPPCVYYRELLQLRMEKKCSDGRVFIGF